MVRSITDNPGGWSRSLPGHTVEYEPGFAWPYVFNTSIGVNAGASATYTLTILDVEHIFFIDMLTVSPQAYKELAAVVYINDNPYVTASGIGWLNIPLRQNPSIQLIGGDHIDVLVLNQDSIARNFYIYVNGTKIKRPDGFGHAPSAYWEASTHSPSVGDWVNFVDYSWFTPTSWEWDFGDGSALSTDQHPSHIYTVAGSYYPRCKVTNAYGSDYYAESTPIVVT